MGSCPTLPGTRGTMRNLLCLFAVVAAASANPLLLGGNNDDSGGGIKPGGGSFPFVTTETFTRTVVTDSYCYTTEKKLLGPKTKECSRKRAIDTSNIFGIAAGDEVANVIAPTVTQGKPNSVAMPSPRQRQRLCSRSLPQPRLHSSAHLSPLSSTCAMVARRTASLTSSTTRVTRVTRVEMVEMEESAFSELESRCHHRGRTVISINK